MIFCTNFIAKRSILNSFSRLVGLASPNLLNKRTKLINLKIPLRNFCANDFGETKSTFKKRIDENEDLKVICKLLKKDVTLL